MAPVKIDGVLHTLKFTHYRWWQQHGGGEDYTKCELLIESRRGVATAIAQGRARCHPNDNFCRATGRKLALARAVTAAYPGHEAKPLRAAIWKHYFKQIGAEFPSN